MGAVGLSIYRNVGGTETIVVKVNKWKFQDTMMGEQFITCTVTSEIPIEWAIGDHCTFRGQTYTLNYIPSVTQKAPSDAVQDAYTYENVKFDSFQDELTRCMMLDITPTTEEYVAALGTNHTGSSRFQLYCGETTVNGSTLTAVCALALKMQANLDRLYPNAWKIYVDTATTYTTASGETILVTHTDSKLLTFDNQTVAQALALVHTEFKLDYCIKGRNIYIGYSIDSIDSRNPISDLTADDVEDRFMFGYGRGYVSASNQGKGLFQIKQIANSQQKIVTRLRALGSTKNLPYNYYFKKYGLLSQALFPNNLQLPGTFLPLGLPTDPANADGSTKWAQNNARSQYLRKVLGDTNDSYIDKNDNAAACPEGIREDCARWDGSNGDLPEIYPTIEGVTFGDLRDAGVPDQTGTTGQSAYQGASVQPDYERIDCLLAVGYTDNGILVDDANIGDGIMPENEIIDTGTHFAIGIGKTKFSYNPLTDIGGSSMSGVWVEGEEQVLFTVKDVAAGYYFMVPTGPSYSSVSYRFSVSGGSADIGFVVRVKQVVDGSATTIATWTSDLTSISPSVAEKEMFLPEIPDQATSGQVESIHVTAFSDVVVTFAPVIGGTASNSAVTLTYQVGRSISGEYDPEYNWGAVQGGVASKYPFHVFIKDMGFDLTATFNGETPVMAMKSGNCVGREFQIGENVQPATVNGIRGYLLTLSRVEDSNLHTYYPNEYYRLSAGDYFVLLNINMPDAYIRAAELRLLKEATQYLADNCETKYTYQPSVDDIYLQRNIDAMEMAGTPEKSIFWRLYAGLKFRFNGIPSSADAPLPLVSMTIEQVSIAMGEGLTPKVDIVLNDDVQQTTLQKLTVAVDRIYNGSIFAGGGVGTSYEALVDIGSRLFLSKTHDDTANGRITFKDIATFEELLKAANGINIGDFLSGFLGAGAHVGADGRGEFEEITVRGALRAAELVFNRISAEEGEAIRSIGHGEILSVDESSLTATLKLEGDEWATIDVGDICRGLYNTIDKDYDNADSEGEDANGFRNKPGFFASYFKVEEILESGKGECSFRYSLQPGTTEHPCELMKFAVYGNTDNTKKERQSCMYITAVGIAPRLLFLAGVNDWQIKPQNIKAALGNLEGLQVYEKSGDSVVLKQLHGDAGLFVEDNVYLGGVIEQFIHANLDDILAELGQGIHAELTRGSDNIVVDALGNIVGGIYNEYDGGNRHYRLHTGVLVYDSGKKRYLTPASGNTIGENEFAIYHNCEGCDVIRDGADFYVTNIHNTNDGISDTTLTDAELELMRSTEECKVNFTIVTHNGWRTIISYPIRITHLDHGYITFSLDNEFDSIAYRTQTKKYDGLPIDTHIRGYVNGSEVSVVSTSVKTNFTTSDMSEETITADDNSVQTRYFRNDARSGVKMELTKAGKLTLKAYTKSSDDIDYDDTFYYFDIKSVVKYAGVSYESAWRRFTLTEITDSTLYKLLLSATAVSKDEGVFTPSSVDVKVQVTNNNGTSVVAPDANGNLDGFTGIKVRYLKGVYSPNGTNNWLTSMPSFADPAVTTCVTIACVDTSGNQPLVLDVQSITINAVGKDGAGQPYVKTNIDQYVVDCNSNGDVLANNDPLTIEAELYWGDNKCGLTNSQCYIKYNGSMLSHDYNSIGESISVSISFAQGQSMSSSNVEISLVGSDGGGDVHSAIKTIAIIANRQGNQGEGGNDGNGIDQVTTYYLLTTKYADVTTSDTGWAAQFAEPTAELPYLWRFTRYTYTEDGAMPYDTPCELIKTYYTEDNPNLLVDALFIADSMGAWDKKGALSSAVEVADDFTPVFSTASTYNTQTNGHRQFRGYFKAKNTNGYITLLSQYVYRDDLLSKVEESQWYTLSFLLYGTRSDQTNADFILAADVSQIADSSSSAKVFIDGQEMSASAAYKNFTVTDTFTRHTMTFKTKSSLSGNLSVVWYMHPRTYTQDVYISEPKLEFGKVATRFSASPFSIEPLTRTSKWRLGMDYQAGQKGEKYLDIVEYNDGWYKCQKSHISTNNNKPNDAVQSTEYWFKANQFEFVATNLLLADRAAINLLSSNVINLFNSSGVKTASINADGNGEYCIHYPTGGKCLTFSYDRFIHCYREDGSEAWRIGLGGDIEKFTSPDFINFPLCSLSGRSGAISQSDTFTMTNTYWRYRSGNASGLAQYDGKIYDSGSATVAPTNPATATAIPDGRYTPDTRPHQVVDSMDVGKYAIIVYVIEDGFVKQTLELTEL